MATGRFTVSGLDTLAIDFDAVEAELKGKLNELGEKYWQKMRDEIIAATGASRDALRYFFYDNGDSAKALIIELDPEGQSHHQRWFGAHFQEAGAPNRSGPKWQKPNEKEFEKEFKAAVKTIMNSIQK